ncbi:ataxin-1-like isoform X1 [Carettochelys insculpta]|uniref:ataxin-1-like isoform X1 n=1 Tax=Carettochelys insculpta TaxID=44489 RepID=UPI003EBAC384
MKPVHERSQECLPPKKRDLPVTSEDMGRVASCSANHTPVSDAPEWCRGVVVTGQSQASLRYGLGSDGAEAVAGLTVDQYGMLYKVAVPPATFSPTGLHPVVNMSPVPPTYNVTSSLIQHPGVPYPPIHYAQIPSTSFQFIGSHYTVPYAVSPSFLPNPLLSPSTNLTTSHVPRFVPCAHLFTEEATPSPQTTSPAHTFSKAASVISHPGHMQHHAGVQPLDITQSRFPVYYQMSRLPPGYSAYETSTVEGSPDPPLQASHLSSEVASANGGQAHLAHSVVGRTSEALASASSKVEGPLPGAAVQCVVDGQLLSGYQTLRTEASVPAHRSTPDTDLEVQRVVGVLASQDYSTLATQRKDTLSPLNLCHNIPDQQGEPRSLLRNPVETAEKSQARSPCAMSPEELSRHTQLSKGMVIANGKPVLVRIGSESIRSSASETLVRQSPDAQTCGNPCDKDPAQLQPPSTSHLPSHFMKGAIIQLATGELKRVEDLQTQDFVRSAEVSGGLKIDSSTVVDIQESQWPGFVTLHFVVGEQQSKVSIDVPPEHPFFVYGQGWSSCSPGRTAQLFALPCHRLQVGDVCISISLQSLNGNSAPQANCLLADQLLSAREKPERTVQAPRELPLSNRANERRNQTERESAAQISCTESSQPDPGAQQCWTAPGFQRYSVQEEESCPALLRPSFIPQEVKLSIEGRSNAGK